MLAAAVTAKSEVLAQKGFWEMMHGSRTDCNAFGKHFLSIKGAGYGSVDNILRKNGD